MYTSIISLLAFIKMLFFPLHISGFNSFPKPLKPQQELEYLKKIKEGDIDARNTLIEHNLRLVVHIIKKYYSNQREQDDLISIGTIGLIKAVSTFDYEKGTKFATYASKCIENEVLMYFRSKRKIAQDISFSDPIDTDKDGNALTLIDIMADEGSVVEDIELSLKIEQLNKCIAQLLVEREREIIILRYGLNGTGGLTQREVAIKLGISRSYVSRIEKKALEILRKEFERTNK